MGLPIVAMDVSSIKDIVGPCGETVSFGDYFAFRKIKYVLEHKSNYLKFKHLKSFSPEKNFHKYLEIYNFWN